MWKLGVAFVRGLNVYGKNRITQRELMRILKAIEGDNLKFVKIVNTDDIIFETNEVDFTHVGSKIERTLKKKLGKQILVTTRSFSTIDKVHSSAKRTRGIARLFNYQIKPKEAKKEKAKGTPSTSGSPQSSLRPGARPQKTLRRKASRKSKRTSYTPQS